MAKNDKINAETKKVFEAIRYSYPISNDDFAKNSNYEFVQVKTVRLGKYACYDTTNLFYRKIGFKELECIDDLWNKDNPCQIYIMNIK